MKAPRASSVGKVVFALGLLASALVPVLANSGGPPLAHTGDFGEPSCANTACHVGNTVNASGGSLTITGLPAQYTPGQRYTLTVTINRTSQRRWGFECAIRQVSSAAQAGNIVATDTLRTEVDVQSGIQYIHHSLNLSSTFPGDSGPKSWSFDWTAPSTAVGSVRCGCAGNAANNNGTNTGDFIYTTTATSSPAAGPTFVTSLFYPRLATTDDDFTGIAVANLDSSDATLRFTAFDTSGTQITGNQITNPSADTILKKGEQLPIVDTQVFGSGLTSAGKTGWFKIESTVSKIVGFFLTFNGSLEVLDGADVSSAKLTSFVLPEVESQGFTRVHVANPSSSSTILTLELVSSSGLTRGLALRTLPANGALAESTTQLFSVAPAATDYIRVSASQAVVPFEFLGKTGVYIEGLNGQDTAAGATTIYSPQYVVGGGVFRSTLSVVNLDSTGGTATFRFIRDNGTQIGSTQTLSIAAKGKIHITDQSFFLNAAELTQGYVEIKSSGPKLAGNVVFGDPDQTTFSTALPLVSFLRTHVVFGQLASNETYFTGLAILNPNADPANAIIDVYDDKGSLIGSRAERIEAGRRVSQLLTQYVSDLVGQNRGSGYFRVTVDQPVATFALFGTNTLSVLSAVPPQVEP